VILIATTLTTFAMAGEETWASWLRNAEAMRESHPEGVSFFAAIETDARGLEPFKPLLARLAELGGEWWEYRLDDRRTSIGTLSRLRHIVCGQNLCTDFAVAAGASHLLFLAADLEPPPDAIPKLLELQWPIVGGEVTTYCLSGKPVEGYAFPVEAHMATAAFVMMERAVFNQLRWRWDREAGMSDDPCLHHDALTLLGIETYVRKDCIGIHHPTSIGAIETRFPGRDMTVYR